MSKEDKKPTTDELGLTLIAGVFLDPKKQEAQILVGEEGIDPIVVFADAVMRNMSMAIAMQQGTMGPKKPRIARARGPLPKNMRP